MSPTRLALRDNGAILGATTDVVACPLKVNTVYEVRDYGDGLLVLVELGASCMREFLGQTNTTIMKSGQHLLTAAERGVSALQEEEG